MGKPPKSTARKPPVQRSVTGRRQPRMSMSSRLLSHASLSMKAPRYASLDEPSRAGRELTVVSASKPEPSQSPSAEGNLQQPSLSTKVRSRLTPHSSPPRSATIGRKHRNALSSYRKIHPRASVCSSVFSTPAGYTVCGQATGNHRTS